MRIDRNNYEEYFLLYVDNELNVDQRRQVDMFVSQNPDLEEELGMLQQLKLVPDNSRVFDKKDLLIKNENDSFINLDNYEEWLVLYMDDEVSEEEKTAIEKFAAAHSHIQEELKLLQKTKLQPEKIVFANKEALYKKEKGTIISLQWWRVAVAAILIIAAGITLYSVVNKRNTPQEKATDKELVKTTKKKEQVPLSVNPDLPVDHKDALPSTKKKEQLIAITPVNKKSNIVKQQPQPPTQNDQQNDQQLASNDNPVISQHAISAINDTKITETPINNAVVADNKIYKENFNEPAVTKQQRQTPQLVYANNENKKLRGFFRKATRLFERATNINPADDDNKVLIGGMAINLK